MNSERFFILSYNATLEKGKVFKVSEDDYCFLEEIIREDAKRDNRPPWADSEGRLMFRGKGLEIAE